MAKAKLDKLNSLHDLLATYYSDILSEGDEVSSGTLAAINTFLKNNNITADVTESEPTQNLQTRISELIKQEEGAS